MSTTNTLKTSWRTNITDVDTTDKEMLGTVRVLDGKKYMWVKMVAGAVTPLVKHALGWVSASGVGAFEVSADVSTCITGVLAGTIQSGGTAPADGEYFWMQIGGEAGVLDIGATPAVGKTVFLSAVDGTLDKIAATGAADTPSGGIITDVTPSAMKVLLATGQGF